MKNNKFINLIIIIISLISCIFVFEFLLGIYYDKKYSSLSLDKLDEISKIAPYNHHIREFDLNRINKDQMYYNYYKTDFKNGKKIGLFGDSWMDYIAAKDLVYNKIKDNIIISEYINAGTTSFAPSLIEIQFKDIISEKKIFFDLVVVYIDQTDFMDEVCDYNKRRIVDDKGELLAVLKPTTFLNDRWSNTNDLAKSITGYNIFRLINSSLYRYYYKKTISKNRCTWEEISKFMYDKNLDDEFFKIFETNTLSLIKTLEKYSNNIIFLTHKHSKHFSGEYKNDVYNNLNQIVNNYRNTNLIEVIDLSEEIQNAHFKEIFEPNDPASHPNKNYYVEISSKISNIIYRILN